MKTLRYFGMALVAATLTFGLASCGGDDDDEITPSGEEESTPSSGETTTSGKTPSDVIAVDLGLPSGTKWANMNIGASYPEDFGIYFAWGETTGYKSGEKEFHWGTYKYCHGSLTSMTKYCCFKDYGTVDGKKELELSDDAAYVNWGSDWRMPSDDQLQELISNCQLTWSIQKGINGCTVKGPNGNSIFLPAAGSRGDNLGGDCYYWSRTLYLSRAAYAYTIFLSSHRGKFVTHAERCYGRSVRPVINPVSE